MRLLGMDAYKAVIEKRDKREFENRPIPEEILLKVLQATRMAGSGKNRGLAGKLFRSANRRNIPRRGTQRAGFSNQVLICTAPLAASGFFRHPNRHRKKGCGHGGNLFYHGAICSHMKVFKLLKKLFLYMKKCPLRSLFLPGFVILCATLVSPAGGSASEAELTAGSSTLRDTLLIVRPGDSLSRIANRLLSLSDHYTNGHHTPPQTAGGSAASPGHSRGGADRLFLRYPPGPIASRTDASL